MFPGEPHRCLTWELRKDIPRLIKNNTPKQKYRKREKTSDSSITFNFKHFNQSNGGHCHPVCVPLWYLFLRVFHVDPMAIWMWFSTCFVMRVIRDPKHQIGYTLEVLRMYTQNLWFGKVIFLPTIPRSYFWGGIFHDHGDATHLFFLSMDLPLFQTTSLKSYPQSSTFAVEWHSEKPIFMFSFCVLFVHDLVFMCTGPNVRRCYGMHFWCFSGVVTLYGHPGIFRYFGVLGSLRVKLQTYQNSIH